MTHSEACETNHSFENMENCWEENLEEIHIVCNYLTSFITRHVNCQLVLCVCVWIFHDHLPSGYAKQWRKVVRYNQTNQISGYTALHTK